jgi:HAD superfamily hydrolase (TIGR01509 family)
VRIGLGRVAAVLFDLDGVLISTDAAVADLWRRVAALVGRELSDAEIARDAIGCTPEHTIGRLFGEHSEAHREMLLTAVRAAEPGLTFRPKPGAVELVRRLAEADIPVGLVTGASANRVAAVLDALHLQGCFRTTVTWDDVSRGKPDPQPYRLAAERLSVGPAECVVIEDSLNGVRSAVAAGAACIGVDALGAESPLWSGGVTTVVDTLARIQLDH